MTRLLGRRSTRYAVLGLVAFTLATTTVVWRAADWAGADGDSAIDVPSPDTSPEPPLRTYADANEAIVHAQEIAVKEFHASGNETAETKTTTIGELALTFPNWFADLWLELPTLRTAYVVYLHGDAREFSPLRGRPGGPTPRPGNTLVLVMDSAGEFTVRLVRDNVSASDPLIALEGPAIAYDDTPPITSTTSTPPGTTSSPDATFTFTGSDNQTPTPNLAFQCQLDGGAVQLCSDGTITYTNLDPGTHVFSVAAIDAMGLVDPTPAVYTWTITA